MSNEKEKSIGDELRSIIKMPTDQLAHILKVGFDTAKVIQSLIDDFLKELK